MLKAKSHSIHRSRLALCSAILIQALVVSPQVHADPWGASPVNGSAGDSSANYSHEGYGRSGAGTSSGGTNAPAAGGPPATPYNSGSETSVTEHTRIDNNGVEWVMDPSGHWQQRVAQGSTKTKRRSEDDEGECSASNEAGFRNCASSRQFMKNMDAANTLMQAGGAAVVNTAGTYGAMKAQESGTVSASYEASAQTMKLGAEKNLLTGAMNLGAGYMALKKAGEHKQAAQSLDGTYKSTSNQHEGQPQALDQTAQRIASKEGYAATAAGYNQRQLQKIANVADDASGEQKEMASTVKTKAVLSMVQGTIMTAQGALGIAAANQAEKYAQSLGNATGQTYQLTTADVSGADAGSPATLGLNTGSSTDPAIAQTDGSLNNPGAMPSLTPPINPDLPAGGPGSGPAAGTFSAGNPASAAGGGGSPNIGVGSMSPSKDDSPQIGARMAESRQNTAYSSGSAAYAAGNGAPAADKSGDLGFLANLLPNPKEEAGKNGILDYGGGRSPASAPYSFLGRDVNIFQRVSDRTMAKLKNGDVGI